MSAIRNARERVRDEMVREIKQEARRQLAAEGAARLSLRAVARELGMVSSALYRYFPSRDDLLTALIIDAYDALGACAERACAAWPAGDPTGRWLAVCRSVRGWALDHPHEYALVYGSPVPGYRAPQDTIGPASRVGMVFVGLLRDAWTAGALVAEPEEPPLSAAMAAEADRLAAGLIPGLPRSTITRVLVAWTQLFGMLSFELFGHLHGVVDNPAAFFDQAAASMAHYVGLRSTQPG